MSETIDSERQSPDTGTFPPVEPTKRIPVTRIHGHRTDEPTTDEVVVEAPMEIRLEQVPLAVLMRTPGNEEDLILGFAITEGMVMGPAEVAGVQKEDDGDRFNLHLADGVTVDPEQFRRNTYTTSSCGVCGKASIDAVRIASPRLPAGPRLARELVLSLPDLLASAQPTFAATGGLHAAAIFDHDGALLAAAEDVGRHNATDKAIGALARSRWPFGDVILMVSGRISFEITQKAALAGISVVAGVSAASSLAVELATDLGMTLVGFVRGGGMVAYTDTHRLSAGD